MHLRTLHVRPVSKGGSGPSEYLFRPTNAKKEPRKTQPILLFGNPERFEKWVRASRSEHPYVSYVLSYKGEPAMPDQLTRQLIHQLYRQLLLGGIAEHHAYSMGVDHGDHEHGVILRHLLEPKMRRFQPYYHPIDKQIISDFQWLMNRRHGFQAPENPACHQLVSLAGKRFDGTHIAALLELREKLRRAEAAGKLASHEEFVRLLKADYASVEVTPHPKAEKGDQARVWITVGDGKDFEMLLKGPACALNFNCQVYRQMQNRNLETYQSFLADPLPLWQRFQEGLQRRRKRNQRFAALMDKQDQDTCFGMEDLHPDHHLIALPNKPTLGDQH